MSAKHSVATAAGFAASVHHEGSHGCGPSLPALQPVAGWSTAERIAPRAGAAPGREHLLERLHQPGVERQTLWLGRWMELDAQALPLTRGQLDIWLAQATGHSSTEWQLGLFVRIDGRVERDVALGDPAGGAGG